MKIGKIRGVVADLVPFSGFSSSLAVPQNLRSRHIFPPLEILCMKPTELDSKDLNYPRHRRAHSLPRYPWKLLLLHEHQFSSSQPSFSENFSRKSLSSSSNSRPYTLLKNFDPPTFGNRTIEIREKRNYILRLIRQRIFSLCIFVSFN